MKILGHANSNTYKKELKAHFEALLVRKDLAYLRLPSEQTAREEAKNWANAIKDNGFKQVAVVGMGGSYLGAKSIFHSLADDLNSLVFFNSSDPESYVRSIKQIQDPKTCHFLIISKSGSTVETLMLTSLIFQYLSEHKLDPKSHVSIITEDKVSALYNLAKDKKLPMYYHPKDVGGRFSVFSIVGLFPLAFASIDIDALLQGANSIYAAEEDVLTFCNEILCSFDRQEWVTIFWPYKDSMVHWCDWVLQLWAESLGKKIDRKGKPAKRVSMPTYCIGSISQHSILQNILEGTRDKFVIFLSESETSELIQAPNQFPEFKWLEHDINAIFKNQKQATIGSLEHYKVNHLEISMPFIDEKNTGKLMMLLQVSIGLIGEYLDIDAYNQPSVEVGKQLLQKKMNSL
jgi:glucose-6-phosphate isomerase